MPDYKIDPAGMFFFLRCTFNGRNLTPNQEPPHAAKILKYDVWIKDQPETKKRLLIWDTWGAFKDEVTKIKPGKITSMDVRDKACIDELFKFNDYQSLKIRRVK